MKNLLLPAFVLTIAIFMMTSCKKEKTSPSPLPVASSARKIKFILYTNKDFSNNNDNISFALHIGNSEGSFGFDSVVARMKIKDIPDKAHQLVFEKTAPSDGTILTAGFTYAIENVGNSWHLDTVASNEKFKVIEYPFE